MLSVDFRKKILLPKIQWKRNEVIFLLKKNLDFWFREEKKKNIEENRLMMTQNCITSSQKCIFYNNNNRNICIWLFLHFFTAPTRYKYQSSLVVVLFVFQLTFAIGSATFLRHNLFINNLATKCNLNCMYFFHIIFGKILCDFFFGKWLHTCPTVVLVCSQRKKNVFILSLII